MKRVTYVTCGFCGKRSYESRKAAKRALRQHGGVLRGEHMSVYRCPPTGGWHIGTLPRSVITGWSQRTAPTWGTRRKEGDAS